MKKLKKLIKAMSWESEPAFSQLCEKETQAKIAFEQARTHYHEQKAKLQEVQSTKKEGNSDVIACKTYTQIAEYQKFISKLTWKLAQHELRTWLETHSANKTGKKSVSVDSAAKKLGKKSSEEEKVIPAASSTKKSKTSKAVENTVVPDDLKKIEGIGTAIERVLQEAGIATYRQLSKTSTDKIRAILRAAGNRFAIHDPSTWSKQAQLAHAGKWDDLKTWQQELKAGKIKVS